MRRRVEKAGPRVDTRGVRVDDEAVASALQRDLREAGIRSAEVRSYPRRDEGPYLRVTLNQTPGFTQAEIETRCHAYVFDPGHIRVIAY